MTDSVAKAPTGLHGWDSDGKPAEAITPEFALRRASWAAQVAYKGKTEKDKELIDADRRSRLVGLAQAYATIALALQNERDYEDRKIHEISKKFEEEVNHAEM